LRCCDACGGVCDACGVCVGAAAVVVAAADAGAGKAKAAVMEGSSGRSSTSVLYTGTSTDVGTDWSKPPTALSAAHGPIGEGLVDFRATTTQGSTQVPASQTSIFPSSTTNRSSATAQRATYVKGPPYRPPSQGTADLPSASYVTNHSSSTLSYSATKAAGAPSFSTVHTTASNASGNYTPLQSPYTSTLSLPPSTSSNQSSKLWSLLSNQSNAWDVPSNHSSRTESRSGSSGTSSATIVDLTLTDTTRPGPILQVGRPATTNMSGPAAELMIRQTDREAGFVYDITGDEEQEGGQSAGAASTLPTYPPHVPKASVLENIRVTQDALQRIRRERDSAVRASLDQQTGPR